MAYDRPNNYSDIIQQLANLQSSTAGISNLGTLKSQFGINPNMVGSIFGGRKRQLASARARGLGAASERMSVRNATPEATFGNIESGYASALAGLEGEQGAAEYSEQNNLINLLYNILQGNNQFALGKNQLQMQGLGGKFQEKMYEEQKPGLLDDILALLNTGSQGATGAAALGWKPFAAAI